MAIARQDKTRQDKTRQDNSDLSDCGCQVIGDIYADNNYGSAGGRVYDIKGISPCLGAAHFSQVKYILVEDRK